MHRISSYGNLRGKNRMFSSVSWMSIANLSFSLPLHSYDFSVSGEGEPSVLSVWTGGFKAARFLENKRMVASI